MPDRLRNPLEKAFFFFFIILRVWADGERQLWSCIRAPLASKFCLVLLGSRHNLAKFTKNSPMVFWSSGVFPAYKQIRGGRICWGQPEHQLTLHSTAGLYFICNDGWSGPTVQIIYVAFMVFLELREKIKMTHVSRRAATPDIVFCVWWMRLPPRDLL